jgi:hypothetical protein
VSDRLDLAGQAPKEGEVWRDKIRTLRGKRCRTLVLRIIPERAEGTSWETEWFVEHTAPGGDYLSKLEDFLRDNERDVPVPAGDANVVSGEMRTCVPHNVKGCKPCHRLSGFVAALEPRVTREMVEGSSSLGRNVDSSLSCELCGASLYVPPEVLVPGSTVNVVERHRAWHDRLERLLEGRA